MRVIIDMDAGCLVSVFGGTGRSDLSGSLTNGPDGPLLIRLLFENSLNDPYLGRGTKLLNSAAADVKYSTAE